MNNNNRVGYRRGMRRQQSAVNQPRKHTDVKEDVPPPIPPFHPFSGDGGGGGAVVQSDGDAIDIAPAQLKTTVPPFTMRQSQNGIQSKKDELIAEEYALKALVEMMQSNKQQQQFLAQAMSNTDQGVGNDVAANDDVESEQQDELVCLEAGYGGMNTNADAQNQSANAPPTIEGINAEFATDDGDFSDYENDDDDDNVENMLLFGECNERESVAVDDADELAHESTDDRNAFTNIRAPIAYKKVDCGEVVRSAVDDRLDSTYACSGSLDILATYLKYQTIVYLDAKTHAEKNLVALTVPAIIFSTMITVMAATVEDAWYQRLTASSIGGLITLLIAAISFFNFGARAQAFKTTASQYEQLKMLVEHKSIAYFAASKDEQTTATIEKSNTSIKELIDFINDEMRKMKAINPFTIPSSVRMKYPIILRTNISSVIKKIDAHTRKLIANLKSVRNEIRYITARRATMGNMTAADERLCNDRQKYLHCTKKSLTGKIQTLQSSSTIVEQMFCREVENVEIVRRNWLRHTCFDVGLDLVDPLTANSLVRTVMDPFAEHDREDARRQNELSEHRKREARKQVGYTENAIARVKFVRSQTDDAGSSREHACIHAHHRTRVVDGSTSGSRTSMRMQPHASSSSLMSDISMTAPTNSHDALPVEPPVNASHIDVPLVEPPVNALPPIDVPLVELPVDASRVDTSLGEPPVDAPLDVVLHV